MLCQQARCGTAANVRYNRALPINRPTVAAAHDRMVPAIAVRQFVAAIGAAIAHRTVARDYK